MELPARRSNLASSQWADPVEFAQHHQFDEKGGHVWLGRSPLDGAPIGFADNRHVCLAGNTRGGKGTSIILPNICSWPGSMVVVDPKGENATVAAARRGQGSDFCEGMGQAVHILDPFNVVVGQEAYQSHFNPLDALDPEHPEVIDRAAMIADALVVVREDSKDPFWEESARAMVKALLLHIITWPLLDGERNLITLRDMVVRGDWLAVESLQETGYDDIPAAQTLLWQSLKNNNALNGIISGMGETYLSMMKKNPKGFDGVRQTVITNTEFLDSPGMRECLCRSDFELSELKTRAEGMSLFLSLPQRYIPTHFRWLRMMVSLVTNEMEIVRQQPATGHPMMMVLDEFAGLERMKSIENAVAQIAGYGVKLFFVLQSLEQLKAVYKDRWETFLANTGVKIFFGLNDHFSREYISKMLGETEVYRDVQTSSEGSGSSRTITEGTSEGESESRGESLSRGRSTNYTEGESYSESKGHSESRTTGESRGFSKSTGGSSSHSTNQNTNQSRNYGTNQGRNSSYGFGGGGSSFGSSAGSNEGSSFGSSSGHTDSKGRTFNKSFSINKNSSQTFGFNQNQTHGRSSSVAHGENESSSESITQSKNFNRTQSESIAESSNKTTGVNQVLHHRPLITPDEIGLCLSPLDDPSHPQYPGFALIVPSDGRPTAVRRCNYFEDGQFIGWYDAHPDFPQFAPPKFLQSVNIIGLPTISDTQYSGELRKLVNVFIEDEECIGLKWKFPSGDDVSFDQPLAHAGPFRFREMNHLKHVSPKVFHPSIVNSPDGKSFFVRVRAPQSGRLKCYHRPDGIEIGEIQTNRRIQYSERNLLAPVPLDFFSEYLSEIDAGIEARKEEEKQKREERRRQKEERKQKDEAEARRIALEKEAAEKRAAEAAEKERLRKIEAARLEEERAKKEKILRFFKNPITIGLSAVLLISAIAGPILYSKHQDKQGWLNERKSVFYALVAADFMDEPVFSSPNAHNAYIKDGQLSFFSSNGLSIHDDIGKFLTEDRQRFEKLVIDHAERNRNYIADWMIKSLGSNYRSKEFNALILANSRQRPGAQKIKLSQLRTYSGLIHACETIVANLRPIKDTYTPEGYKIYLNRVYNNLNRFLEQDKLLKTKGIEVPSAMERVGTL